MALSLRSARFRACEKRMLEMFMHSEFDRLDSEIALLGCQITQATHRLLCLIRELDERELWASGGFLSCAQYLSFRIGLSPGAAREKVRVARALGSLPLIDAEVASGAMSFSKARAITRFATPDNQERMILTAHGTTASQLERVLRLVRRVESSEFAAAREDARCFFHQRLENGMIRFEGCLLAEEGELLIKALRAMPLPKVKMESGQRGADAIVLVATAALRGDSGAGISGHVPAETADSVQLVVHVDQAVLFDPTALGRAQVESSGVSAETVRRIACDASVVEMTHDEQGTPIDVGRKTRVVSTALKRALRERDKTCVFPGCDHTIADAHHLVHWCDGGETNLDNLLLLCRGHHRLLHEHGFSVTRATAAAGVRGGVSGNVGVTARGNGDAVGGDGVTAGAHASAFVFRDARNKIVPRLPPVLDGRNQAVPPLPPSPLAEMPSIDWIKPDYHLTVAGICESRASLFE